MKKYICFDCPLCAIDHETHDGDYAYRCRGVTTGNGGTTHPIVGYDNDNSIKEPHECLLSERPGD